MSIFKCIVLCSFCFSAALAYTRNLGWARALFIFISIFLLMVFIAGCGKDNTEETGDFLQFGQPIETDYTHGKRFQVLRNYQYVYILLDKETGCQYLWDQDGGFELIVDAKGNPYLADGYRGGD